MNCADYYGLEFIYLFIVRQNLRTFYVGHAWLEQQRPAFLWLWNAELEGVCQHIWPRLDFKGLQASFVEGSKGRGDIGEREPVAWGPPRPPSAFCFRASARWASVPHTALLSSAWPRLKTQGWDWKLKLRDRQSLPPQESFISGVLLQRWKN